MIDMLVSNARGTGSYSSKRRKNCHIRGYFATEIYLNSDNMVSVVQDSHHFLLAAAIYVPTQMEVTRP
jgi:hypothetical protein